MVGEGVTYSTLTLVVSENVRVGPNSEGYFDALHLCSLATINLYNIHHIIVCWEKYFFFCDHDSIHLKGTMTIT